jgi:hypothetical protein
VVAGSLARANFLRGLKVGDPSASKKKAGKKKD